MLIEESSQLSSRIVNELVDYLKVIVYQADLEGNWLFLNEAWHILTGYTVEESIGRNAFEFVHPDCRDSLAEEFRLKLMEEMNDYYRRETRLVSKEGKVIDVDVHVRIITHQDGERHTALGAITNIFERKQIEEQLNITRQRQDFLLNALPVVFYAVGGYPDKLRTQWVSDGVEKISGFPAESYLKTPCFWESRLHPEDREHVISEAMRTPLGSHMKLEYRLQHADGSYRWLLDQAIRIRDENGQTKEIIGCWLDITDRKQAEEALKETQAQLLQAQKLESIGRLAGGVAHDFNNLLTAIIGNAGLMQMNLKPGDPQSEYIDQILAASQRAAELVRQLLTFARKQVVEPRVLNINQAITDMKTMLQRLLGEDIELTTWLDPELIEVKIDPVQLEQVILNLATNARDAMPRGGRLLIETKNLFCSNNMISNRTELHSGRYTMLAVHDTGMGINPEDISNIFEPFFTTKEVGKGTGLGLATCYGIIKRAGGHIEVQSEPGQGTVFRIYLPAIIRKTGEN